MFYKLETYYNDYETVKRTYKTKIEYLDNVLENIKLINSIKLIKPNDSDFEEIKQNGNFEKKSSFISLPFVNLFFFCMGCHIKFLPSFFRHKNFSWFTSLIS